MRPRLLAAIGSTTDRVATHDLEFDLGDVDEPKGIGVAAPRPSWSLGCYKGDAWLTLVEFVGVAFRLAYLPFVTT